MAVKLFVIALFFSLYIFFPLASSNSTDFQYCNKKANYAVKVSGVDITPYPVKGGKETTFSIAATTDKRISGGKLVIDVKYLFLHVHKESHDICKETSCPVSGDFVISHSQELPGMTPPVNGHCADKKANYAVKISGVDITPYPVKGGKETTFSIAATTDDNISGGKLIIDVKYLFLHVHHETHDICKETSCPVSGDFVLSHSQALPGIAPPGSYTLTMKMVDGSNQELSCITFGFSMSFIAESIAVADA